MAKDDAGVHHQEQEGDSRDRQQSRLPQLAQQVNEPVPQTGHTQEFSSSNALTPLLFEELLQSARSQSSFTSSAFAESANQIAHPTSNNSSFAASALMNFRSQGSAMEGPFGVSASQRQLLSALLSEGISSARGPISLQSFEALQRNSASDRSLALFNANRALQEQILMNELLRSPSSQRSGSQTLNLNFLENGPVTAFQGYHSQSPRIIPSYSSSQQRLNPPSLSEGAMLPPRSVDMLAVQPNTSATLGGSTSSSSYVSSTKICSSKGAEEASVGGLRSGDDTGVSTGRKSLVASMISTSLGALKRGDNEVGLSQRTTLPPNKRRKTVNFRLESVETVTSVNASFPLPPLTEEGVIKFRFDTPTALLSFKSLWDKLSNAGRGRKELFRRRLQKGKVPIAKKSN